MSRYTNARTDALSRLGQDPNPSFHTSQVSDLDSEEVYQALDSTGTTVAGKHLLARLMATPLWPNLFISGQVFDQLPPPSRKYRSTLSGEVKPPTRSIRRYIAYTMQILKYAIIGRDMHGIIHALLMIGMSFRRVICDRNSDDIYVDIGTPANAEDLEIQDMTLEKLLWYGHVAVDDETAEGPSTDPAAEPATSSTSGFGKYTSQVKAKIKTKPYSKSKSKTKSKIKVETKPPSLPDKLFYHLSKPNPSLPKPQSDLGARHALISFLNHMGQSHFDILRNVNETAQNPLPGLTGRWARVKNVTMEQLGIAAAFVNSAWSAIPEGTSATTPSQNDGGSDGDSGDDHGDEGQGEDGGHDEEGDGPGRRGHHTPTSPDDQADGQYGKEVCWQKLGYTAFQEERKRWLEDMKARYEPFTRC